MAKKRKKRGRKKSNSFKWGFLLIGFLIGFASAFLWLRYGAMAPHDTTSREANHHERRALPPEKSSPPAPRVAILIDDMGANLSTLKEILRLDSPITISVLPHLRHSREVSRLAALSGRDVLLHLPMEPKNSVVNHAGRGVLLTSMTESDIKKIVAENFLSVPEAIGANNHMGSRFTEDEPGMRTVFAILKEKGLFFVDSRTTAASLGSRLAAEVALLHGERDVFLDNKRDVKYIDGQLATLVSIARKRGSAIAIGHPYRETLAALREMLPAMKDEGIEVVPVSELLK